MPWRRPLVVVETADLRDVDPARAWVLLGDLARLPEWTSAEHMEGEPGAPQMEDEFSAVHRFGPFRYRVVYQVRSWEPGRRFRLAASGWPFADDGEVRTAVEAMIEPGGAWSRIELVRTANVAAPVLPLATRLARGGMRRALRRVAGLLR